MNKDEYKTAKMTTGVPIVTCLHRVRRIHKVRVRDRVHRPGASNAREYEQITIFDQYLALSRK